MSYLNRIIKDRPLNYFPPQDSKYIYGYSADAMGYGLGVTDSGVGLSKPVVSAYKAASDLATSYSYKFYRGLSGSTEYISSVEFTNSWDERGYSNWGIYTNANSSTGITAYRNARGFTKYTKSEVITFSFWFNFNNQLNGSGGGVEKFVNNELVLIKIMYDGTQIGKVYYDYLSNTIRFGLTSNKSQDAYAVLNNLDASQYIVAMYKNGSLFVSVNGKSGVPAAIPDTTLDPYPNTGSVSFKIDATSLKGDIYSPSALYPDNFILSDLAIFDYELTQEQINHHFLWAGDNSKPLYQSMLNQKTSSFFFVQDYNDYGFGDSINGEEFADKGSIQNLEVGKDGLRAVSVLPAFFNTNLDSTASYTNSSASGISISGSAGVDFTAIGKYFNFQKGVTFSAQVKRTSASPHYIFSIDKIGNKSIFVDYDGKKYNVKTYDARTGSTTVLLSAASSTSLSQHNLAVTFSGSGISIYSSDTGSTSTVLSTASPVIYALSIGRDSTLTIGNLYDIPKINYSYIKNFGMYDTASIVPSTFDYTSNNMFMMKFTSSADPLAISQKGSWTYSIPSAIVPSDRILGVALNWDTMENCVVSVSTDNGNTFDRVYKNNPLTKFNPIFGSKNIIVKVDIETDYTIGKMYQTFDDFTYVMYTTLDFVAQGTPYKLTPILDSSKTNYTLSFGNNNLLSHPNNIGIKFWGDYINKLPGSASISIPPGASYSAIEFWWQSELPTSSYVPILYTEQGGKQYAVFATGTSIKSKNGTMYIDYITSGSNVDIGYLPDIARANSPAEMKELRHIVFIPDDVLSSDIILNGTSSFTWGVLSTQVRPYPQNCSYGFMEIWDAVPASSAVYNKFSSFVSRIPVQVHSGSGQKIINTASTAPLSNHITVPESYKAFYLG